MFSRMKTWARRLNRDGHAIYLASRDPRVPWYAKFLAIAVAGDALSPIDLIPDFIPVVGYLDDLIIVPLRHLACGVAYSRRDHGRVSRDGKRGRATSGQQSRNGRNHDALDFWGVDAGLDRLCPLGPTKLERETDFGERNLFIRDDPLTPQNSYQKVALKPT